MIANRVLLKKNQTVTQRYQQPFSGPRATESVYSSQSQASLFWPITDNTPTQQTE